MQPNQRNGPGAKSGPISQGSGKSGNCKVICGIGTTMAAAPMSYQSRYRAWT